jgi:hypothetical protein
MFSEKMGKLPGTILLDNLTKNLIRYNKKGRKLRMALGLQRMMKKLEQKFSREGML